MSWNRHRFKTPSGDSGPVIFPPPGPYWCSGFGGGLDTIICFLPAADKVETFWPEAAEIESKPRDMIEFTDRFPCPDWWAREVAKETAR